MKGTMLVISPSGSIKTCPLHRLPDLDEIQREVGGWIEQVPSLNTIDYHGTVHHCVTFCNEDGKLNRLPVNQAANRMWDAALQRSGQTDLRRRVGMMARTMGQQPALEEDVLVGKIVVIFGDDELMDEL